MIYLFVVRSIFFFFFFFCIKKKFHFKERVSIRVLKIKNLIITVTSIKKLLSIFTLSFDDETNLIEQKEN